LVIDYQQLINFLIQILKPVIDYTNLVITREEFQKIISKSHNFSNGFYMAIKGLFICDLEHEFAKSFSEQKVLFSQRAKKIYPLKNSLANTLAIQ